MQFMALCALFLACLFRRRFPFMVPFGFLLSGFALLVSYLGQMNPQITPLMPVLVSPWLSTHVSLIMMSYALFAFMMLNGILALCLRRSARMLMLLSRLLLYPAVFFWEPAFFWVRFGPMLGALLGLGPEGSMGADYLYGLWSGVPCAQPAHFPQSVILPYLYGCRLSDSPDDLFRGELHPWRNAQLCQCLIYGWFYLFMMTDLFYYT